MSRGTVLHYDFMNITDFLMKCCSFDFGFKSIQCSVMKNP